MTSRSGRGNRRASRYRAAPYFRRLVIMVKQPVMGNVKTRLGREVGASAATMFYRHAASSTIRRLAGDPRWQVLLAVSPDTATQARCWPPGLARMPQGGGDLGKRMQRLSDLAPPGPVLIMGTDIPGVTATNIEEAFRLLDHNDTILGPAEDGGYWLVGFRRTSQRPRPFGGVRWSSPDTLTDTVDNLRGWRVAYAATHCDVDNAGDLGKCRNWAGRVVRPPLLITRR